MCGICGKISKDYKKVFKKDLKKMTDLLIHRGPDGEGFYLSSDQKVGLGHRRLAIIDLKTGSQPISNEDKNIWLVFNGEIYNFLDLKKDLIKKGHCFKTQNDTEVIIHSFEEYGQKCVNFFNGIFIKCYMVTRTRDTQAMIYVFINLVSSQRIYMISYSDSLAKL